MLLVDDNQDAVELLALALQEAGFITRVAIDGPGALELLQHFTPDAAILDIGLPVMDGYELAAHLRRAPGLAHLPLIAVTGYGQREDRQRSRAAGFDEHLVKPIELSQLPAVLGSLLQRSAQSS